MNMTLCGTFLLLGPDERLSELLLQWLAPLYYVVMANSPLQTLQFVAEFQPALLLFSYQLDEITGIELYDLIHKQPEYTYIPVLLFGSDLRTYQSELAKRNLIGLSTPLERNEVMEAIQCILN